MLVYHIAMCCFEWLKSKLTFIYYPNLTQGQMNLGIGSKHISYNHTLHKQFQILVLVKLLLLLAGGSPTDASQIEDGVNGFMSFGITIVGIGINQ